MSIEILLDKLDKAKSTGTGYWLACCPAHEDRNPSLSIHETDDGTILLKCWAGCTVDNIVAALGMGLKNLFPNKLKNRRLIKTRDTWIPRDVINALAEESMLLFIAAETMAAGRTLTEEDNKRLLVAARRFHAAAREVGYD